MKGTILLFLALIFFSCQNEKKAEANQNESLQPNFDWLSGQWQRTNEEAGKSTYEYWDKLNASHYKGLAFTLKAEDTTFKEYIDLIQKNDTTWIFEVKGNEDAASTIFTLSHIGSVDFVSENPAHDFPKKITYERKNDSLYAAISGGGTSIPFVYVRMNGQ